MGKWKKGTHKVSFSEDRPVLVMMPDGKHRVARMSLTGHNVDGRMLTLRFVENGKETGECVRLYL